MNCKEIRQIIDDYLENDLNPKSNQIVSSHLESCPECEAEIELFELYNSTVKSIQKTKAPGNFLAELHQKMEKQPLHKRIAEKLLLPLRYKRPVHAFGLIIIAVFIFVLYKPFEQMQKKATDGIIPIEKSLEPDNNKSRLKDKTTASRKTQRSPQSELKDNFDRKPTRKRRNKSTMLTTKEKDSKKQDTTSTSDDSNLFYGKKKSSGKTRKNTEELADDFKGGSASGKREGTISKNMSSIITKKKEEIYNISIIVKEDKNETKKNKMYLSESRGTSSRKSISRDKSSPSDSKTNRAGKPGKSPRVVQQKAHLDHIRQSVTEVQGRIISEDRRINTQRESKNIVVEIPTKNYSTFLKKLKKVGTLKKTPGKEKTKNALKRKSKMKVNVELSY